MKPFLVLLLCLIIPIRSYSWNGTGAIGAHATGLANTGVVIKDHWSVFNNIAGIATTDKTNIGVNYDRRFNFAAFSTVSFAMAHPFKYGSVALGLSRFGDELYNENRIIVGYAHKIRGVSLGASLEYAQMAIYELGSKSNLLFSFGGMADITKHLSFGAYVFNVNQARVAAYQDERIPTTMKIGFAYQPVPSVKILGEVAKSIEVPAVYKMGISYTVIEQITVKFGMNMQPQALYAGLGFKSKSLSVDYATSWYSVLGFNHSISLNFVFGQSRKPAQ